MKKMLLIVGMLMALAGQWLFDYAKTEITRDLLPASPSAQRLMKSLVEDVDWQRQGDDLVNERLQMVVGSPSLFAGKSSWVRRLGSSYTIPGFSGDDAKLIGKAFPDAYQLAGERELARHLAPLDPTNNMKIVSTK